MPDDEGRQQGWEEEQNERGEPTAPHGASPAPDAPSTGDPWSSPSGQSPDAPPDGSYPPPDAPAGGPDPFAGPPAAYGPPGEGYGQPPQYGPPPGQAPPPAYGQPPAYGPPAAYGPPPAYGPAPAAGYGYAGPRTSTSATVVLVCGIASLFVPCIGLIPAIFALAKAGSARREILSSNGRLTGLGMITAGKITAWLCVGLTLLAIAGLIIAIAVGSTVDQDFNNGDFSAPDGV